MKVGSNGATLKSSGFKLCVEGLGGLWVAATAGVRVKVLVLKI